MPSVLWRCWLGSRKGIRPVKTEWWGAGVVICLDRVADLHMAQLMPQPLTVCCCFGKIQIGSPGKRPLNGCVCHFVLVTFSALTWSVGCQEEHLVCKIEWWGVGVVMYLEWGADCLHIVQLMPLHPKTPSSLASFQSRLVLPFWYQLT